MMLGMGSNAAQTQHGNGRSSKGEGSSFMGKVTDFLEIDRQVGVSARV